MHIVEKWILFVFCQKRRSKDQQLGTNLATDQQQPHTLEDCPSRRVLLEGAESWPSRPASHSPAQMEPLNIRADIHLQPDVLPETRFVSYSSSISSKRRSGVVIEDDIEVLAPMATSEM